LNRAQLNNINFNGKEAEKKQEKRRDIYAEMPIRALGYTNEIGEALRPVIGNWAWASWVPAIAYIGSDIADKYQQDEYGNQIPSGERATKQLSNQLLASVLMPTAAVKLGQTTVDMASGVVNKGISFSNKEKISNFVLDSMNTGEHKAFLDASGNVNKTAYAESLYPKMSERIKHKETHNMLLKPFYAVKEWLSDPFLVKPNKENINKRISNVVDRLVNTRQNLLDDIKPEKMSNKMFKKFGKDSEFAMQEATKLGNKLGKTAEETAAMAKSAKQGVAFNYISKMEKSANFKNKILLSAGGFVALSLLAKPIDHFVENVVIKKAVEPTIALVKGKKSTPTKQQDSNYNA
jgi:hypothetical protein